MPRTYQSLNTPRVNDDESINGYFAGTRASALGTTTATATISMAQLVKDMNLDTSRAITLAITDMAVYTDVSGSTLQILSGAVVIWTSYVGNTTGIYLDLESYIVGDKGQDISLTLTGATAKCSVAFTARAIIGHAQ